MPKNRNKPKQVGGQPVTRSTIALSAMLRSGAGVHEDQRRRQDPKALRRDKSYKRDWS